MTADVDTSSLNTSIINANFTAFLNKKLIFSQKPLHMTRSLMVLLLINSKETNVSKLNIVPIRDSIHLLNNKTKGLVRLSAIPHSCVPSFSVNAVPLSILYDSANSSTYPFTIPLYHSHNITVTAVHKCSAYQSLSTIELALYR